MKKLLFAIAGAAAFSAAATDYDVLDFETFNLTSYPDGVVANKTDTGADGSPYRWVCAGDDASTVKAYDAEFTAPNITGPAQITGTNAQYLNLDTNGSELKRNIKDDGTAQSLNAPLYIDTLVQFTPSESAPSVEDLDGAKLAIWLSSENGVTNLCVRGLQYSDSEISVSAPVTYAITNVVPQPGTWYRLTVKAVPAVLSVYGMVSAFTVAIDGVDAVADKCLLIDSAWDTIEGDEGSICTAEEKALIKANKVFGSMADLSQTGLTSVGFKGTGALDDFVVTDVAPDFTPAGGDDYKVTIGGSEVVITPQDGDLTALQAAIVAGGGTLDVTDVDAVNAALAASIPGSSPAIPSWQALFLGVAPTTNGLEQVAIDSITMTNGIVTVEMSDDLTLMTGRGVDIVLNVVGSDDLSIWDPDPLVAVTNSLVIPAITPAANETKKFYKVVVDFAGSSN